MNKIQGIILAGGSGSRLNPLTHGVSKQLLPLYDKPMIFYPLSTLMLAGIQDILIITKPIDSNNFSNLLGDGSRFGININYALQPEPKGIADAFNVAKNFVSSNVALILGDNFFYGSGVKNALLNAAKDKNNASIFGYQVSDPERFGVINFNPDRSVKAVVEKPTFPESNIAAVGLYFYPQDVLEKVKDISKSERGELEISCLNNIYIREGRLRAEILGRGTAWFDTGTVDSLLEASNFVKAIQKSQGYMIACLEEIGLNNGWLDRRDIPALLEGHPDNDYYRYISGLAGSPNQLYLRKSG